ncbi:MAG: threonine--tRNA ligase [Candidatus Azambacteria bacterium]|nr:threonine--tRNA ligase [Candidatus Azambacteria bacterium]
MKNEKTKIVSLREISQREKNIRHSLSHLLAAVVLKKFPDAKLGIGPIIENGFYYDFLLPRSLAPEDLKDFEKEIKKLISQKLSFASKKITAAEAKKILKDQPFKLELINEYTKEKRPLSIYKTGDVFIDLCAGGHVKNSDEINPDAFKLTSIAGAYWRGDEKNPQLQRIYGVAFESKKELDHYLWQQEEAKKRDHRRLGKELDLFYFSDDIGPGLPLFTPKGEIIRHLMESYVREVQTKYGFQHVWTGHLVKEDLYKKSGHYDNYKDAMFPPMVDNNASFRLKPMNCPSHMTLYNKMGKHSYRELPLRFAEFATLYRYEKTGELSGLTRVRTLTQDDCHTFCTEEQIESEFSLDLKVIREVLNAYQFMNYKVRLSLRGKEEKYVKDDKKWAKAESALRSALKANKVDYYEAEGEAAFYGPKADFMAKDILGREWQLSTIQVDFIQPGRLNCVYVAEDGSEKTPVLLHRAVTGTTERFMGIIIEHYAGAFPVWLSPVQVKILNITDRNLKYSEKILEKLKKEEIRAELGGENETIGKKIREAELEKIPYILIVGDKEEKNDSVAIRERGKGDLGTMNLEKFIEKIQREIENKI